MICLSIYDENNAIPCQRSSSARYAGQFYWIRRTWSGTSVHGKGKLVEFGDPGFTQIVGAPANTTLARAVANLLGKEEGKDKKS